MNLIAEYLKVKVLTIKRKEKKTPNSIELT